MNEAFRWWLALLIVGAVPLPLLLAFFRRLPDRGYALARPFGLLLLGYVFWFLNSVRLIPNNIGGIIFALLLIAAISAIFAWRERDALRDWFAEHALYVAAVEVIFIVVFAVAAVLRAKVGYADITEQPMDFMYVNAATRASHFPPADPWLSGYTVAYYYFGYLIVAMTSQLAQVPTDVGYNLGLAMIAAMALVGAAGLVYNLVRIHIEAREPAEASTSAPKRSIFNWRPPVFGVLGGLMLVVMGNLAWVFVFASAYGIGGRPFYDWIDIMGLGPDTPRTGWFPSAFFGFFNASRIYPLNPADDARVITEFPMFSFILGDLHPHVMSLPFVLLAVAAAFTLFRHPEPLDVAFWLRRPLALFFAAVLIGGLAFLNTWDVVTMAFVVVAAATLRDGWLVLRARAAGVAAPARYAFTPTAWNVVIGALIVNMVALLVASLIFGPFGAAMVVGAIVLQLVILARLYFGGWLTELAVQALSFAVPLIVLAVLLYLPFYASFTSQADGIAAVVSNSGITVPATKPLHLAIFWGPLFVIVLPFVFLRLLAQRARVTRPLVALSVLPSVIVVVAWAILFLFEKTTDSVNLGAGSGNLFAQIGDRGQGWLTFLLLAALLAGALLALWLELTSRDGDRREREPVIFTLGLATIALLLVLGTEFFFVGDVFRNRMNTVFKLYYQAWLLLAVAGGFSLYYLFTRWDRRIPRERLYRFGWGGASALVIAGAALYPIGASRNRIHSFAGSLHATAFLSPDEQRAIDWLQSIAQGQRIVIAEAVGNDYTRAARFSTATGVSTVIGWQGHEDQWRGGRCQPCAGRFQDVQNLYQTADMNVADGIIEKYGITFIIVGDLERQQYGGAGLEKFASLPVAFQSGAVTIYRAGS